MNFSHTHSLTHKKPKYIEVIKPFLNGQYKVQKQRLKAKLSEERYVILFCFSKSRKTLENERIVRKWEPESCL